MEDREAWRAVVHGVAKSLIWLSNWAKTISKASFLCKFTHLWNHHLPIWSGLLFSLVCSLLSFPIWGQGRISPRNLLKLQVNISTQKIVSFTDVLGKAMLELCQTYTRCFMHAYLILQYVSKIILAYSLAPTRCFMQASFLSLCVGVWYLSSVSYILGANACMLSLPYE